MFDKAAIRQLNLNHCSLLLRPRRNPYKRIRSSHSRFSDLVISSRSLELNRLTNDGMQLVATVKMATSRRIGKAYWQPAVGGDGGGAPDRRDKSVRSAHKPAKVLQYPGCIGWLGGRCWLARRGKSGLRRAERSVTPTSREVRESATESIPPNDRRPLASVGAW